MVDFIAEVEEELRKDDYNKLLRKWGPWMAGAAVLIVAAAGFYEWNKAQADRTARSASITFAEAYNALDDGDLVSAEEQFEKIGEVAGPGYAGLSYMQAAALAMEDGRYDEALSFFDKSSEQFELPRHTHLPQLKAAYLLVDLGRYDDAMARLRPLVEEDMPYRYLAMELRGHIMLAKGDKNSARSDFSLLSRAPGVPDGVQERARQMLLLTPADPSATEQDTPTDINDEAADLVSGSDETPAPENGEDEGN